MLTFRAGAPGGLAQAEAYVSHLLERTLPEDQEQLSDYYARLSPADRTLAGEMGSVARPAPDMAPEVARTLGIDPTRPLTREELGSVLAGRRADGEALPGAQRSVAWMDLCLSAPKSLSVAWFAAGTEAERQALLQVHRDARDATIRHIEEEVAVAGFGDARRQGGEERGRLGFVTIDHYTARPTVEVVRADPVTGVVATELYSVLASGDPQLHTHTIVPNVMVMESGRVIALDSHRIAGRVKEFGALYQAFVAQGLRKLGVDVELDPRPNINAARLTAIPQFVSDEFSKRTTKGEAAAREFASRMQLDWGSMSPDQRVAMLKAAIKEGRQGKGDDLANAVSWREQAERINWRHTGTVIAYGPPAPALERMERLSSAAWDGLPHLEDRLSHEAVVTGSDVRLAAARGLISRGIEVARDVRTVSAIMVRNGVRQEGKWTTLIWPRADRDRPERFRITTALHRDQEAELIETARRAAQSSRGGLPAKVVEAALAADGVQMNPEQRAGFDRITGPGKLAVVIGAAGSGKTTMLRPATAAWKATGAEVWGTALAWRQANALREAGIDGMRTWALNPLLTIMRDQPERFGKQSVVVIDELGQVGTSQFLKLLRFQKQMGFKLVAVGDDRQCQAVDAGPTIDLLRQALGAEAIPEILTTIRQQSERELELVALWRAGRAAEALAEKRTDNSAELVPGGYEDAVRRVVELWRERTQANAHDPRYTVTVSAPTNNDAMEIGRAIRQLRMEAGEVARDGISMLATDKAGNAFALQLAAGDRVRLFARTRASFPAADGKSVNANIGDNGSVLTVVEVRRDPKDGGLVLQTRDGKVGFVPWQNLRDKGTQRFALAYGDCLTINTAQGITSDEHISAMPSGSQHMTLYKAHVGGSRHRVRSFLVGSHGAELREVEMRRPIGSPALTGRDSLEEAWKNVERNLSRAPVKESALALLGRVRGGVERARETFQQGMSRRQDKAARGAPETGARRVMQQRRVETGLRQAAETLTQAQQELKLAVRSRAEAELEAEKHRIDGFGRDYGPMVALGQWSLSEAVELALRDELRSRTGPLDEEVVPRIERLATNAVMREADALTAELSAARERQVVQRLEQAANDYAPLVALGRWSSEKAEQQAIAHAQKADPDAELGDRARAAVAKAVVEFQQATTAPQPAGPALERRGPRMTR